MRITGKQPIKPSPSGDFADLPFTADPPEGDQERDEESVSDTQDYQLGSREFRDALVADNDEHAAPPEVSREAREAREEAIKERKQDDNKASPLPSAKPSLSSIWT